MKCQKGQSSAEFMVIFSMLLLIMVLALWIGGTKSIEMQTIESGLEIQKTLDGVVAKINTVYLEGHGFSTKLNMPQKINSLDYVVSISGNTIFLERRNITYSSTLLTENVTGNIVPGVNLLTNENGIVVIT